MDVLNAKVMDNLIIILNYKDVDAEALEDVILRTYLTYVNILDSEKTKILETINTISAEDLHYNRYYWFIKFKNRYFDLYGHDEGIEQQAYKMLENIDMYLENGIDWTVIECIDNGTIL